MDRVQAVAQRGFDGQRTIGERALDAVARLRPPTDPKTERPLHDTLRTLAQRHPGQTIWLFDRHGRALAGSALFPVPRSLDISDQAAFEALRTTGAEVGVAVLSLGGAGAERSVGVALRVADASGGFAGVVVAAQPVTQFLQPFQELAGQARDAIVLVQRDGSLLLSLPAEGHGWPAQPRYAADLALRQALREGADGVYRDGAERPVIARRLDGVPVAALLTGPAGDAMAGWRASLLRGALLTVPMVLLLCATAAVAWRRAMRETAAHARVREALQRGEAAEEALRRAQRIEAMGQLTGGVAHDFNNLLQIMASSLVLVRMGPLDARQQRAVDAIETAATRGESLTRQLLSFSRRQTVAPTALDLREQLPKFLDLMRHSLRGNISVMTYVAPDLWPVHVDLSELQLAVLNLGVNARDAMPQGGSLSLEARNVMLDGQAEVGGLRGDFVMLTVADNGCGIPPDILPKVFEPFVTTKEVGKGTGLGLSQVYGFAQQAGGLATIASEPAKGTAVMLLLPRSREAVARAAEDSPETAAKPVVQGNRETILLVEDNPQIAEATSLVIENLGFHVVHASDAKAALEVLGSGMRIDLLFSDIIMPGGMTGLELARLVREHEPTLPILLTTGYSGSARDATAEGFTILRKPYNFSDFSDIVRRLLPTSVNEQRNGSVDLMTA
ncbi:MAG TPA: ATP-binding protein [Azospirillum sp.]|nr:ATP-binding protein [Azospirillum sp.]